MRRVERWGPLALGLVLLVALGSFGLVLMRSSRQAVEVTRQQDAVDAQGTVAALADQYLQLAAKEAFEFGVDAGLRLEPGDRGDARALAALVGKEGGFFNHAAVLAGLDGEPINRSSPDVSVPPSTDPGYAPLTGALLRGEPGVSSVMEADGAPVVAVGVPVLRGGEPAAVVLGYFRADTSQLQRYSEKLGAGPARGMVVDSDGRVVASRDVALVGQPAPWSPAVDRRSSARPAFDEFRRDGVDMVAASAPIPTGGWLLVEEQPAQDFYAAVRSQSERSQAILLGLLVSAGALATALNHRTLRARRRGEALVHDASDVIVVVGRDGVMRYVSPAIARVLGHEPREQVGRPAAELVHPDDLDEVRETLVEVFDEPQGRRRLQARVRRADGSFCPCDVTVSNLLDDRSVQGLVISMRDIEELVELHEQLTHQALHDPLTGLPNRALLEQRVLDSVARCAQQQERRTALLFVDLDGFKVVNDRLGHERGDAVLVEVAEHLRACAREGDTVARIGGDEFVLLLDGIRDEHFATDVARRVVSALSIGVPVGSEEIRIGASVGIAFAEPGSTPDELLRDADLAMYLAKERGRSRFELRSSVPS